MDAIARVKTSLVASEGNAVDKVSANFGGDLITMPWIYKLLLEGRVFIGGMGFEATDIDGQDDSIAEENPTWLLRANAGIVAIPLYVRLQLTTEGGAAPDAYLTYVNTGTATPIAYTSGTAGHVSNALGGYQRSSNAVFTYTNTTGTFTSTQNVVLWQMTDTPDDLLTTVAVDVDGGSVETPNNAVSAVTIPMYPHIPLALTDGAMLAFYAVTGTTDSKWRPTFVWAELPGTQLP
jgi:hypothetical protein